MFVDPNRGFGVMTPQEREDWARNMPDVTGTNRAILRQRAIADKLREASMPDQPHQRMDWASQAARALSGGISGYREAQATQQQQQLMDEWRRFMQTGTQVPEMVPGQYSGFNPQYGCSASAELGGAHRGRSVRADGARAAREAARAIG